MKLGVMNLKILIIGFVYFTNTFIKKNSEIYYLLLNYPAGHWDFSKGRIEKGEEKIKTARREIKEETNISEINMYDSFKKEIKYNYKVKYPDYFQKVMEKKRLRFT